MLPRGALLRRLAAANSCLRGASKSVPYKRDLSTMDSTRFISADFIDLSGKKTSAIKARQNSGILHYSSGPAHAPIAVEVRFRITDGPDPARFANGRDLLLPDMPVPWSISFINLPSAKKTYGHLCNVLFKQDGSASLELATSIREHKDVLVRQDSRVVHSLGQPPGCLCYGDEYSCRFRESCSQRLASWSPVRYARRLGKTKRQYTGLIKCSLEVISCNGVQGIAFRVLEIIQPIGKLLAALSSAQEGKFRAILGAGICARYAVIISPFVSSTRPGVAPFKGQALVKLVEEPAKKTFHLYVHKVMSLQMTLEHDGALPVPEEGATVKLGSGPHLWKLMQEMRESQTLSLL